MAENEEFMDAIREDIMAANQDQFNGYGDEQDDEGNGDAGRAKAAGKREN